MPDLSTARVAILTAARGVERSELVEPRNALLEADVRADLVSPADEVSTVISDLEPADSFAVDVHVAQARAQDYDLLLVPGGTVNADSLRLDEVAIALVHAFVEAGRPVAAICHGPWALVESGDIRGKTVTSYPSLRTDVRNAGGTWQDEAPTVCTANGWTLVTARNPGDLEVFNAAVLEVLAARPART